MLNVYARTFMVATRTDSPEAGQTRPSSRLHRGDRPGQNGWLGDAWRRLVGRAR